MLGPLDQRRIRRGNQTLRLLIWSHADCQSPDMILAGSLSAPWSLHTPWASWMGGLSPGIHLLDSWVKETDTIAQDWCLYSPFLKTCPNPGPDSWVSVLCSHVGLKSEGSHAWFNVLLSLPKILHHFLNKSFHILFHTGPPNYVAGLAPTYHSAKLSQEPSEF